jgi:uncharacterized DUF497 family protein
MEFKGDENKAEENFIKHGVSFQEAKTIFDDPLRATGYDGPHSGDEIRWRSIGYSNNNRLIVVSHTEREGKMRIISARRPTRTERETYERG